jgi:hypothetical protein
MSSKPTTQTGIAADGTRPHLWLLPFDEPRRPELNPIVGECDGDSELVPAYGTGESCRMNDAAIDGIRVDVISTGYIEVARGIRAYWRARVPKRASDVHVCRRITRDETGIVAAPRSLDLGNGIRRVRRTRRGYDEQQGAESHDA